MRQAFNPYGAPGQQYPHQRPAHDPWLQQIVDAGVKFWRDRGVYIGGVNVDVADNVDAMGVGLTPAVYGQSRVVLDGNELGARLAVARNKRHSVRARRQNLQQVAQLVYHELGHVGGLDHIKADGLMNEYAGSEVPWSGQVLSRRLVPHYRGEPKPKRLRGSRGGG